MPLSRSGLLCFTSRYPHRRTRGTLVVADLVGPYTTVFVRALATHFAAVEQHARVRPPANHADRCPTNVDVTCSSGRFVVANVVRIGIPPSLPPAPSPQQPIRPVVEQRAGVRVPCCNNNSYPPTLTWPALAMSNGEPVGLLHWCSTIARCLLAACIERGPRPGMRLTATSGGQDERGLGVTPLRRTELELPQLTVHTTRNGRRTSSHREATREPTRLLVAH